MRPHAVRSARPWRGGIPGEGGHLGVRVSGAGGLPGAARSACGAERDGSRLGSVDDPRKPEQPASIARREHRAACGDPPEGRPQWSLRLLADRAVELGYIDSVSHETVRRVLKKNAIKPWRRVGWAIPAAAQRRLRGGDGAGARHLPASLRCERLLRRHDPRQEQHGGRPIEGCDRRRCEPAGHPGPKSGDAYASGWIGVSSLHADRRYRYGRVSSSSHGGNITLIPLFLFLNGRARPMVVESSLPLTGTD